MIRIKVEIECDELGEMFEFDEKDIGKLTTILKVAGKLVGGKSHKIRKSTPEEEIAISRK